MTALETLAKYGLKSDVKSIRERLYNPDNYFLELKITFSNTIDGTIKAINAEDIVHDADLSLLCSLAEKGEALETPKPVKVVQGGCGGTWKMPLCPSCGKDIQSANDFSFRHCPHCGQRLDWKHPITEAEGERK